MKSLHHKVTLGSEHLTILIFALCLFCHSAQANTVHGVLRVVKGDVRVIQGIDGKEIKAKIGQKVLPHDMVVAGKDSRAKIVMIDNNEINVAPETKVQIEKYELKPQEEKKNVLIKLLYGKVRAKVNQKYDGENSFQVKTPSAVAGVRGTDFLTGYSPSTRTSQVVTFSGRVAVGLPGAGGAIQNPVMVAAGQMTSAVAGGAPTAPVPVPRSELIKMENSTDADKASEPAMKRDETGGDSNSNGGRKPKTSSGDDSSGDGTGGSKGDGVSATGAGGKNESRAPASAVAAAPPPPPPPPTTPAAPAIAIINLPNSDILREIVTGSTKQKIKVRVGN